VTGTGWEHVVVTVHLLGIRHHGPGSARSVLRALDDLRPDIVLVEAPADVDAALRWVGEPGLVPPVALLTYVPAEPGRAAFAPFATFSPEWQAIAWANRHDIEVHAIDLPLAVTLAAAGDDDAASLVAQAAPPDPLRELAAAAGDPDPERWWEDVIEHRGDGAPAFDAVADAMAAAREGFVPTRRELQREAHMRRAIRAARRAGTTASSWCAVRGTSRRSTSTLPARPTSPPTPPPCAACPRSRPPWRGSRGPIAGSQPTPATPPASTAPAGIATCSTIPAATVSPGSSSMPPDWFASAAGQRRPIT
jgi:hypothetical protein